MQNWQSYVIRLIHPLDHTGSYLAGALHLRPRSSPRQKSDTIAAIPPCPAWLQEFAKYVACPRNCLLLKTQAGNLYRNAR